MDILFASSEAHPLVKTGGLADVAREAIGEAFDLRMRDDRRGFAMDLRTTPSKPRVFQGPNGFSRKSDAPGAASLYYSFTRLATTGAVAIDGREVEEAAQIPDVPRAPVRGAADGVEVGPQPEGAALSDPFLDGGTTGGCDDTRLPRLPAPPALLDRHADRVVSRLERRSRKGNPEPRPASAGISKKSSSWSCRPSWVPAASAAAPHSGVLGASKLPSTSYSDGLIWSLGLIV